MTDKRLHQLLDLYYDGRTTLRQERALRRALARYSGDDRELTAARAVMAFVQTEGSRRAAIRAPHRHVRLAAAASVAVALGLCAALWLAVPRAVAPDRCYAVISGHATDDEATAIALMDSQLAEFADASEAVGDAVSSDLGLFSDFM